MRICFAGVLCMALVLVANGQSSNLTSPVIPGRPVGAPGGVLPGTRTTPPIQSNPATPALSPQDATPALGPQSATPALGQQTATPALSPNAATPALGQQQVVPGQPVPMNPVPLNPIPGTVAPSRGFTTGIGRQGSGTAIGQQGSGTAIGQQGSGTAIGQQGTGTAITPTNGVVIGQPEPFVTPPVNAPSTGTATNFGSPFGVTNGFNNVPVNPVRPGMNRAAPARS